MDGYKTGYAIPVEYLYKTWVASDRPRQCERANTAKMH